MKKDSIMVIGDLPDNVMDHFLDVCDVLMTAYEEVIDKTNCRDIQLYLNAIQYTYCSYLASYLHVSKRDNVEVVEEYVEVMRKNVLSRLQSLREEKTPGI